MPKNKNAELRYKELDKCFCNHRKRYTINDLIDACSDALSEMDSTGNQVSERTIRADIKLMRSESGFNAPIETYRENGQYYYRYSDRNFSIFNHSLNSEEAQALKDTISTLSRFKGLPNFEWMNEVTKKLEISFNLDNNAATVVGFDQNIDLEGLKFFEPIFNAIVSKRRLTITYKPFYKDPLEYNISPYYLKQYNNRWFLFGKCDNSKHITNLPLDRIQKIKGSILPYIENTEIDFNEYFDDIVGVTHLPYVQEETVKVKVADSYYGYFKTKPIYSYMKETDKTNHIFEMKLFPNYELETYLLSHADEIQILEPQSLKDKIIERIKNALDLQTK